jgi:tRNA (adenine37-N6)-methyltransferase
MPEILQRSDSGESAMLPGCWNDTVTEWLRQRMLPVKKLLHILVKGNDSVTDSSDGRPSLAMGERATSILNNTTAERAWHNLSSSLEIPTIFELSYRMKIPELICKPIGVVQTPYKTKYGAPRQPASAKGRSVGIITLQEGSNFDQALEDLRGFDYVWVLFWFHENKNWKPKVLPPHGGRTKRGLFSTRSPHRPNPIGLSLCKLLEVKGRTIRIENPDMLDGTPVLDIKPYLPHAEAHPKARGGWISDSNERSKPDFTVSFAPGMKKILRALDQEESREIVRHLSEVLARDPHPHVYRRIKVLSDGTSLIAIKRWRFLFSINDRTVRIFGVAQDREREANL